MGRFVFRLFHRILLLTRVFVESITLSKEDKLYKDAIETAATSGIVEVAEDLLSYFVYVHQRHLAR